MISDDTEHTCMVAQSLIEVNGVAVFTKRFAKRLRWWILALPVGVGKPTAWAGIKLWLSKKLAGAGVYWASNGPAMRTATLGAGVGKVRIPAKWLNGIAEYPRSVRRMQNLGEALADSMGDNPPGIVPSVNPFTVLIRNVLFLLIVLFHGFRRLAPPD